MKHLCTEGYKFIIAPEVFSLHKGIRQPSSNSGAKLSAYVRAKKNNRQSFHEFRTLEEVL